MIQAFMDDVRESDPQRVSSALVSKAANVDQADLRRFPGLQPDAAADDLRIHAGAADVFAQLVHHEEVEASKGYARTDPPRYAESRSSSGTNFSGRAARTAQT